MKHHTLYILYIVISLFLFGCTPHNGPDNPSGGDSIDGGPSTHRDLDYLFDIESVPHIKLTLTASDWNTYLANFDQWPDNSLYVPAAFEFTKNGTTYTRDSVGLRPRGNTTRRRPESSSGVMHSDGAPFHRAHFGIRFTKYETGERFFGCDRLILKWNGTDPAYVREAFCYDLFHRFNVWSAPRASFCRLTIYIQGDNKPVYMGVYTMIQNPRKGWLDAHFHDGHIPDKDGNLWKAGYGADLSSANRNMMGLQDDYGKRYPYNLKNNHDYLAAAQTELCDFINGMTPLKSGSQELQTWLENHMDVDLFLRAYAVNVMVGMWDDYWKNKNNFYFYFDSQHRFYFIPFDYDNTLGTAQDAYGNPGTDNLLYWGSLGGDRILMRKVMSISAFQEKYKTYLKQLATSAELMEPTASSARISHLQSLIRNYVANDTGEDITIEDRPADWSSCPYYRLLSGSSGDGKSSESNFFKTKVNAIWW